MLSCRFFALRTDDASLDRKCLGGEMSRGGRMQGRGIFDKDVRRKPLGVAADAYGD